MDLVTSIQSLHIFVYNNKATNYQPFSKIIYVLDKIKAKNSNSPFFKQKNTFMGVGNISAVSASNKLFELQFNMTAFMRVK